MLIVIKNIMSFYSRVKVLAKVIDFTTKIVLRRMV